MCFVIWQLLKMVLPTNTLVTFQIFTQLKHTLILTWICWNQEKFYKLFAPNQKVYTKVKNEEPTYYAASSDVKVSQFASGSLVRGKVDHSVVSRNVDLAEGSTVTMQSSSTC